MEVIVVDDGSTDSTPEICDKYAESEGRLKVFHKCNGGVSSARNVGLLNACGTWIAFVDSDDVLSEDAISLFQEVFSDPTTDYPELIVGNMLFLWPDNQKSLLYSYELKSLDMLFAHGYWGSQCNKLFNRDIVINNNIFFDESLHFGEDWLFVAQYCKYVNRFSYVDKVYYIQYLSHNYAEKYNQYNGLNDKLNVYSRIKSTNPQCAISLVDSVIMRLLSSIGSVDNADVLIADFKSAVGRDIRYAKGKKKFIIRSLSFIDSLIIWRIVLKLYSRLPLLWA